MASNIFFGIDLGTSNSSISYVVGSPRLRGINMIPVEVVQVPIEGSGQREGRSSRVPSIIAKNPRSDRAEKAFCGFKVLETGLKYLERGKTLFHSVKSSLGSHKVYLNAFSPELNTPEKVSAQILKHLCDAVKKQKGTEFDPRRHHVVITVPASFDASQRQDTLEAARLAGLKVEEGDLLDEPVAALIDLMNHSDFDATIHPVDPKLVLMFDFGGGTCDLSLVRIQYSDDGAAGLKVENLAISPYCRLGGDNIDLAIMNKVIWPQIYEVTGLKQDDFSPEDRKRVNDANVLKTARSLKESFCEKISHFIQDGRWNDLARARIQIKETLEPVKISGDRLVSGRVSLDVESFSKVMAPFIGMDPGVSEQIDDHLYCVPFIKPLQEILEKAGKSFSDLDFVVMHGGACKNPYVQRFLEDLSFQETVNRVQILKTPDLDTSVSRGAAIHCYRWHSLGQYMVPPIASEEIGIITLNEQRHCLVKSGTMLPFPDEHSVFEIRDKFVVPNDRQEKVLIPIYAGQGDSSRVAGSLELPLKGQAIKGQPIIVRLRIDANKVSQWWFHLEGSDELKSATVFSNPWTQKRVSSREEGELVRHRQRIRQLVVAGEPVSPEDERSEAFYLYKAGYYQEAMQTICDYISRYPNDPNAYNIKGLICGSVDEVTEERSCYTKAVELAPTVWAYRGNLGASLVRSKDYQKAIFYLRQALANNPRLRYIHSWLSRALLEMGDTDQAANEMVQELKLLRQELASNQGDIELWERLEYLCRAAGFYDEADEAKARYTKLRRDFKYGGDSELLIAGMDSGIWRMDEIQESE